MQKINALACARVSRFSFFAFTASPVWRFSFIHSGLWVKAFIKRLHPLCTDAAPLKACTHTEPMRGEKRGRGTEKRPIYAGLPARFFTTVGEGENRKVNHDLTLPFTLKQLTTNPMCHTVKE